MAEIVFDLEADNLIDDVTQIWCGTFFNLSCQKTIYFVPEEGLIDNKNQNLFSLDTLELALKKWINKGYTFVGHNILKYDREVFKKILGIEIPLELCQDTFIWSQMLWPDITIPKGCKGRHGLEAWGIRFGIPKPTHEDWTQYSPEMLHRNIEDVKINTLLWEKIVEKIQ